MKKGKKGNYFKFISVSMAVLLVMLSFPSIASAAQPPVELGTTASYAVLAGQTITNKGPTVINGDAGGDVGLHPGESFPGETDATISGTVHLGDADALQAKNDLVKAYDDAARRTPVTHIPVELGGTTLTPGTYDSDLGYFEINGTLTLDAQGDPNGVFVFKTKSTLITFSGSRVLIKNGARYCRTFWQVGSSATLGTNSHFVGHILALTSITAETGASVQGQLLARNGSVTLDSNTIMNGLCATKTKPTPTPTPKPSSNTVNGGTINGGTLPKTSTPLYTVLFIGVALILAGAVSWRSKKSYE